MQASLHGEHANAREITADEAAYMTVRSALTHKRHLAKRHERCILYLFRQRIQP